MIDALKNLYNKLVKVSPTLYFLIQYYRSSKKIRSGTNERNDLFNAFVKNSEGKRGLQISVKDEIGQKFGDNWVSVDKYDESDFIDHAYDINDLKFEDNSFDVVVCWSVLEHVPDPHAAIAEMSRVLKPGGEIWVQLPFLFPYHESPQDYWRVTPDGLRLWMSDYEEISCGCDYWSRSKLAAAAFFHGKQKA